MLHVFACNSHAVSGSQVTVNKLALGEVHHSFGNLVAYIEELPPHVFNLMRGIEEEKSCGQ